MTRVVLQHNPQSGGGAALFFYDEEEDRIRRGTVVFSRDGVPKGSVIEKSLHVSDSDSQAMMDALWDAGYRPARSGVVNEGVAAHLKDLRDIIFKCLDRPSA